MDLNILTNPYELCASLLGSETVCAVLFQPGKPFGATNFAHYAPYVLLVAASVAGFGLRRWWRARAVARRQENADTNVPVSLHPIIDPLKCIGCGLCTKACPEGQIIGMIAGKAQLVDPGSCIGHGACKTACPADAIDLVFGTARRGVDIPVVSPSFESTVPGLYIAGELGGMGLIANAIEQGKQAIDVIARQRQQQRFEGFYDVVIVGGGPAGISASLAAQEKGLSYITLEQDTLGGTVARYPRGKVVMTRRAVLPRFGVLTKQRRLSKETLLGLWQKILQGYKLQIMQQVRVDRIRRDEWGFEVSTTSGPARAHAVLLATGRRGAPQRLNVPGENEFADKVYYGLDDPARYRDAHVLVVGGGDSALEAVIALAQQRPATLVLSYRGFAFARAKPALRRQLDELVQRGLIDPRNILMGSHVLGIGPDRVQVNHQGTPYTLPNHAVIVCAGGVMPTALLNDIGVAVERKYGTV